MFYLISAKILRGRVNGTPDWTHSQMFQVRKNLVYYGSTRKSIFADTWIL